MGESATQNIVVNRCYGGFGISVEALSELLDMECPHIEGTPEAEYFQAGYYKTEEDKARHVAMCSLLRRDGIIYHDKHGYGCDRDCPHLVALIEVWGSMRVSGAHAELEVVEIPVGVNWVISEYDGQESVEEAHRSW